MSRIITISIRAFAALCLVASIAGCTTADDVTLDPDFVPDRSQDSQPVAATPEAAAPAPAMPTAVPAQDIAPTPTATPTTTPAVPPAASLGELTAMPEFAGFVATPDGHTIHALTLPLRQALGGNLRAGDVVTAFGAAEIDERVVAFETFGAFEVVDATPDHEASTVTAMLALEPNEVTLLTASLPDTTIYLGWATDDGSYALSLDMTAAQALDGQARGGETVSILKHDESGRPVTMIESAAVLFVSTGGEDLYRLTLDIDITDVYAFAELAASGDYWLAPVSESKVPGG